MMMKVSPVLFYFILLEIFKTGEAQTDPITMACPAKFTVQGVSEIVCTIKTDDSRFGSECAATPTDVSFNIIRTDGQGQKNLCTTGYSIGAACSDSLQNDQCGCTKKDGALQTYTLKYVGKDIDRNAKVMCSLCAGGPQPDLGSCTSLNFVDATTTTASTTTERNRGSGNVKSNLLVIVASLVLAVCLRKWAPHSF